MAAPYYVTHNAGGAGIGTEGDPFTLVQACDTVAAGETVYVKASGAYSVQDGATSSVFNPSTAGTVTTPIVWQGYHTTINDGGIVEIDADTNNLNYGLLHSGTAIHFQVFKNFEFWGANQHGATTNSSDNCVFKNCSSHNNGAGGFSADNNCKYENCLANNNTGDGFSTDVRTIIVSCVSHTNALGFNINEGFYIDCLSYGNSDDAYAITGAGTTATWAMVSCTADGENTDIGLDLNGTEGEIGVIFNNIFHDCSVAIDAATDYGELVCMGRNLYNSTGGANVNILAIDTGDGIGDRGDVEDPANLFAAGPPPYALHATSGALVKGLDSHFTVAFWADYNEGAGDNPPAE